MIKKWLIGLLALSVCLAWSVPDADARKIGGTRTTNGVLNTFFPLNPTFDLDGITILDEEFGLGDDCSIEGTLYCAPKQVSVNGVREFTASIAENDANELACRIGKTASRVILIDITSIPTRLFNPGPGSLEQLPRFAEKVSTEDPDDNSITLYTGTDRNAAW